MIGINMGLVLIQSPTDVHSLLWHGWKMFQIFIEQKKKKGTYNFYQCKTVYGHLAIRLYIIYTLLSITA